MFSTISYHKIKILIVKHKHFYVVKILFKSESVTNHRSEIKPLHCILFLFKDDFVVPIPICPIRNTTKKIDGINSYTVDTYYDLIGSYKFCTNSSKQKPGDLLPPIDPDNNSCFPFDRRSAFSRCKNNCNRGKNMNT